MLNEVGVNVDCLPMLDVRQPGATDIVGDRALGSEPMQVAALGRAILDGLASAGVLGVIKHIPGHGRALVDSHTNCRWSRRARRNWRSTSSRSSGCARGDGDDQPLLYTAWDPERPASQSPIVIHEIIRQRIGFDGFLMSDDIGMEALAGDHGQRAAACVAAGCDAALHCDGKMENMVSVASAVPALRRRRKRGWRGRWRCASPPTTKWISPSRRQARRTAGARLRTDLSTGVAAFPFALPELRI